MVRLLFVARRESGMPLTVSKNRFKPWMVAIIVFLLSGCASWSERFWVNAPGWSRAAHIGDTATREIIPVVVEDQAQPVTLLVSPQTNRPALIMQALKPDGGLSWEQEIPVEVGLPDERQLVFDGRNLHAFWMYRGDLYHVQVSADGQDVGEIEEIPTRTAVGYFATAVSPTGQLALWYSGARNEPGLFAFSSPDLDAEQVLVDELGTRPSLQFDDEGNLHALWLRYPPGFASDELYYAKLPGGAYDSSRVSLLLSTTFPMTQVLNGPRLGLDRTHVYVAWAVEVRTGMAAGDIVASYLSFPVSGLGAQRQVNSIRIPTPFDLPYTTLPDIPGEWVPISASELPTTPRVIEISFLPGQPDHAIATFKAQVDYRRRKTQWQVGAAVFNQGAPVGYQMLSFTASESTYSQLASDGDGFLYATWLEGSARTGGIAYLASTAPSLQQSFGRITFADVSQMIAESLFGMASGVVLFWFPLIWLLGSLVVLFLTSPLRREDQPLLRPGVLISLVLAVAAFWVAKLFIFPLMFSYVPFSAWIPILPASWSDALRLGTPIAIGLIALFSAIRLTYARENRSPLYFILLYGLIDGLLTLAIYGVIFWGDI